RAERGRHGVSDRAHRGADRRGRALAGGGVEPRDRLGGGAGRDGAVGRRGAARAERDPGALELRCTGGFETRPYVNSRRAGLKPAPLAIRQGGESTTETWRHGDRTEMPSSIRWVGFASLPSV